MNFDYLSYNEGCILQVVHSSDSDKIHIKGIIKGINKLNKFEINKIKESEESFVWIMLLIISCVIGMIFANIFANANDEFGIDFGLNIATFVVLTFFILIPLILSGIHYVFYENKIPHAYLSILAKDWSIQMLAIIAVTVIAKL